MESNLISALFIACGVCWFVVAVRWRRTRTELKKDEGH